jgi:hypothetical protein
MENFPMLAFEPVTPPQSLGGRDGYSPNSPPSASPHRLREKTTGASADSIRKPIKILTWTLAFRIKRAARRNSSRGRDQK